MSQANIALLVVVIILVVIMLVFAGVFLYLRRSRHRDFAVMDGTLRVRLKYLTPTLTVCLCADRRLLNHFSGKMLH